MGNILERILPHIGNPSNVRAADIVSYVFHRTRFQIDKGYINSKMLKSSYKLEPILNN